MGSSELQTVGACDGRALSVASSLLFSFSHVQTIFVTNKTDQKLLKQNVSFKEKL